SPRPDRRRHRPGPQCGAGASARSFARRHRLQYRHAAGQAAQDQSARTGHPPGRRAAGRAGRAGPDRIGGDCRPRLHQPARGRRRQAVG
ncbi:hypothetical protein LTR94_036495, partial [Friedmanniomyces endolithicus]